MIPVSAHLPAPVRALVARGLGSALISGLAMVFVLTLTSKVVSFVKDAVVASTFGVADEIDAFMLVFGFMSFAATLLAGGLPESFLPVYVELKHRRGVRRADRLGVQVAVTHLGTLLVIGIGIILAGHLLLDHLAHGFSEANRQRAQQMLPRLLPFLLCFGLSYHLGSWLRADKRFLVVAAAPLLVPLTIIACILVYRQSPSVDALLFGTNLGAGLQCCALLWTIARQFPRERRWWRVCLRKWEPSVRQVLQNALPFLVGGFAFSSAAVVDQTMASWLPAGSVTVLSYSEKLCMIILGVCAGPLADVLFPYFADQVARNDWKGLRRRLLISVSAIASAALPLALLLEVFAPTIVGLLFERGAFHHEDTLRVAHVLRFGALQIPFYILGIVTARVIVSMQASRFMLIFSFAALFGNAGLNWLLMQNMGVAGIALSTALVHGISSIVACLWCLTLIRRKEAAK
ncbi:MAG: polysaccharide biosynthesis C-terminal domain-containing protein [Verrucomicrobiaceae bacterium]|nr:polysaccharide biosynthesis C-terminal domain-containing protein [Verrucomicrobiaceae bacterium]